MSGLEALGATASVLQLVELCAKCSRKTAQIVRSYRDAPKEIKQLAMKVEMLKFQIEQLHYEFLQSIRSMAAGDDAPTKGTKLQWALIDKKKTNRVVEDVASIQQVLDQIFNIVSVRLATVQQSSLAALRISNAALLSALEVHMQEIKATIGTAPGRGFEFVRQSDEDYSLDGDGEPNEDQEADSEESDEGAFQAQELDSGEEFDGEEGTDSNEESEEAEPSEHTATRTTATLFESITSTYEGWRQMTRYPLTTAFYYSLHLAGFRVDMDDDGDIWYDDDDCDRYSDAVEDQEDYNKPGPLGGTCKICRDPEGYGLGHILEEAEEGLVEWRYERQKSVDRGALEPDGWEWPSWTRKGGRV
ncbi:hypothetical protein CSOJ01_15159 [Colletotrichum sojae]|uniref:Fungal N-terminal domain-containing protein n=1 Tax=Colletotrichum sojae TaxID=2175907 RepID=A0A8H6MJ93_9PEZI|nr:hypothetical protein CSOJ01_15159 [Colletotrichum sojae]